VFGGLVKLGLLSRYFPNRLDRFNILYLISSALPTHAVAISAAARRGGARLVVNQNGVAYPAWHGEGWERTNQPMKEILLQADYVLYQSAFCKQSADRYLGERNDRYEILYNSVDTDYFIPLALRNRHQNVPVYLLLAGSHWEWYRVETSILTLRELRNQGVDARLVIAGNFFWDSDTAAAREAVQVFIRRCNLTDAVTIHGPYTQEEAPDLFRQCHILLHTKYNDPCPTLVVEAMACGLPVVYSASGGVPELVGDEGGIGVEAPLDWEQNHAPSPELLATAVKAVMENYESYARQARQRAVRRFGHQQWIQRHRQVFDMLIGDR
jgi:glycosyltransferase involved in cell wall biosynthesis